MAAWGEREWTEAEVTVCNLEPGARRMAGEATRINSLGGQEVEWVRPYV